MALLGILLFGTNYWLVYLAEIHLPSGLVAVVFSSIIFLNIINGALFLKSKIRIYVVYGAIIGIIGIVLVFKDEILFFSLSSDNSFALSWQSFLLSLLRSGISLQLLFKRKNFR
jgi:drug/metabolite transporter (DMT)-like permease